MSSSFYSHEELMRIGFGRIGKDVLISRKASIYGAEGMEVGDNARIDDFCILSGNILIGSHVHVAAYSAMYSGKYEISVGDFTAISSRVAVYAESDDYVGGSLSGTVRDERFRHTKGGNIYLGKHVLIGSGSTILPDIHVGEGTSVGAMSLINDDLESWSVYVGIPVRKIKERSKEILGLEKKYCMVWGLS